MLSRIKRLDRLRTKTACLLALTILTLCMNQECRAAEPPPKSQAESPRADSKNSPPSGSLLICGGGALPSRVFQTFLQLAGDAKSKLVVIPTASGRAVDEAEIIKRWKARGFVEVEVLHTRDRSKADTSGFVAPLKSATAIWFVGGQQSRLAEAYQGGAVELAIIELFRRGGVIGGTSAGAAIQSRVMIQSGNPTPTIAKGMNLLPNAIIDQHFLYRNRFNRLLAAVRQRPECVGVGIDESTAIVYCGGKCKVIGESYVTLISAGTPAAPLSVKTFREGQTFLLER